MNFKFRELLEFRTNKVGPTHLFQ